MTVAFSCNSCSLRITQEFVLGGSHSLTRPTSRRPWLIPGIVAAIAFVGGVAGNLVASDLQPFIGPYGRWAVWIVFVIALVITVIVAITHARRGDQSGTAENTRSVNASGDHSVAIGDKVERSTVITGEENVVGNKIGGDNVAGNKYTYISN